MELSLLGLFREPGEIAEIMLIQGTFPRVAPAAGMRAAVVNENCQN